MKSGTFAALAGLLLAAGCSGGGSNSTAGGAEHNDSATGVRLMNERPLGSGSPQERVARMAECAAILDAYAVGPPPQERAEFIRRKANRLMTVAEGLATQIGQNAADVRRIRETTAAANRQFAGNQPDLYRRLIEPAAFGCEMGDIMTEEELTGRPQR